MMKKYLAVGFTGDKGQPVELIPSCWLINENNCFWPNEKDPNKLHRMITKCVLPNDNWSRHPITIYGKSNSFVKAGEKVKQARILSSIESDSSDHDIPKQKRQTKLPIRYRELVTSDDESQDLLEDVSMKASEKKFLYTVPEPPSENICNEAIPSFVNEEKISNVSRVATNEASLKVINDAHHSQMPIPGEASSFSNFLEETSVPVEAILEKVLKNLADLKNDNRCLKKEIRKLQDKVDSILTAKENPNVVAAISEIREIEDFYLPLKNVDELQSLEDEITKDTFRATSLAHYLCRGGGFTNINTLIRVIMKRLLCRNVAVLYSLEGRQGKKKFADLNLFNVVIASIKMRFEEAELSFINSQVGKVLAGAVDWDGNRTKRKRKETENIE